MLLNSCRVTVPFQIEIKNALSSAAILSLVLSIASPAICHADERYWVGYQNGPTNPPATASWFDSEQWLNNLVPGASDWAIFDDTFDPQDNGMPKYVYFGDYSVPVADDEPASPIIPGGKAQVWSLSIRRGDFTFDFGSPLDDSQGSLSVSDRIEIGVGEQAQASLTVLNGTLGQNVLDNWAGVSVGLGVTASGQLIVDGPTARVEVLRDLVIGDFGGTGRVDVLNGAQLIARSVGNGFNGPEGQVSVGTLNVAGEGSFVANFNGFREGTVNITGGGKVDSGNRNAELGIGITLDGATFGGTGNGLISGAGSTWTNIDWLAIGSNDNFPGGAGEGHLVVSEGGALSTALTLLAGRPGAKGSIEVIGSGSHWSASHLISIGERGFATASVSDGGKVTAGDAGIVIGAFEFGDGNVEVANQGQLETTGWLVVGGEGKGQLTASGGSTLTSGFGRIGADATGTGEVNLSGEGTSWALTESIVVGDFGYGKLTLEDQSQLTTAGWFTVGDRGTGELRMSGGSKVQAVLGRLGVNSDSEGKATVTGLGTKLSLSDDLLVGDFGKGSLLVDDGASVEVSTDRSTSVGANSNSIGELQILAESSLATGHLNVGQGGTGKLQVDQSSVSVTHGIYVGNFANGEAQATNGAIVSSGGTIIGESAGVIGSVVVDNSSWQGMGVIGSWGNGSLTVQNGGQVDSNNAFAFIGINTGGEGHVTVTGSGSQWSNIDRLTIGGVYHTDTAGAGYLTIENGGRVESQSVVVGNRSLSQGQVEVRGSGSEWTTGNANFGDEGHASVLIAAGATLTTNGGATLGSNLTGVGAVTVDGEDTRWVSGAGISVGLRGSGQLTIANKALLDATGPVLVGDHGNGTLQILDSATLLASALYAGRVTDDGSPAAQGVVLVQNSEARIGGQIRLGDYGVGKMTIDSSVVETAEQIQVGTAQNANAENAGYGELVIQNGATLHSSSGIGTTTSGTIAAFVPHATGMVLVTGAGSKWLQDGNFSVGSVGTGTLQIKNQGHVESKDAQVARTATASADVEIDGQGTQWVTQDRLVIGGAFAAAGGVATVDVANEALVKVGQRLHLWEQGTLDVSQNGAAIVGNAETPIAATVLVATGGTLSGTGTIVGDVLAEGGIISPGASPGVLHIDGNLTLTAVSQLLIELGGLTPGVDFDQLDVSGNLLLEGLVTLSFVNGFVPNVGDQFELFEVGGQFNAEAAQFVWQGLPSGLTYDGSFANGVYAITITAVPEPSSWILAGVGVLCGCAFRRRRMQRRNLGRTERTRASYRSAQ